MNQILDKKNKPWPDWKLQPPPKGAPGVGQWTWRTYQRLRKHRDKQGLVELWARFHQLYRGKIFQRTSKWSQVIANFVWKSVNASHANLTDNKPTASIMPRGNTSDEIADKWQAAFDMWWELRKLQAHLSASVKKSETYGFQVDQMRFNPDLEAGLGEIEAKRWDTYGVLLWPGRMEIQDSPAIITYEAMELGEIYERWPDAEDQVKADAEYSELIGQDRTWVRANRPKNLRPMGQAAGYVVPGDDGSNVQSGGPDAFAVNRALVVTCWCKDYSMMWVDPRTGEKCKQDQVLVEPAIDPEMGIPVINPDGTPQMQPAVNPETGEPVVPEQWSVYPGYIRCVVVTNKGNLVLEDMPNPNINPNLPRTVTSECYLWDKFPFLKRLSYSDDISEYGLSILEQIETLVVEVCKKLTQYGVHLDTQCRNPLILPQGCGVTRDDVNNKPNRIWTPVANMATAIRFLDNPSSAVEVVNFVNLLIQLIDMITGITDVSEGRRPQGVTAASAIGALQEKAQTIFREKIRNNDLYLEELGRMFISLGQNWYTEERRLRYEGKAGEEMLDFRGIEEQGELSFHVEAGSTLPRNRGVRQAQVLELAKVKPNFPDKVLLKELSIPNQDEVAIQMQQGPLMMLIKKLMISGLFDQATVEAVKNVAIMPDKDFKRNFGSGNPLDVKGRK